MYGLVIKMILFMALAVGVVTANSYVVNGPLLKHNNDLALKQFESGTPATSRDFQIEGYSVPFGVVYVGEAMFLALVFTLLFGRTITRIVVNKKES